MTESSSPLPLKTILFRVAVFFLALGILLLWCALYMFVLRPMLFQSIMSALGWHSITVPIALHVVVVIGVPVGVAIGIAELVKRIRALG
jgi:hypothetical protein